MSLADQHRRFKQRRIREFQQKQQQQRRQIVSINDDIDEYGDFVLRPMVVKCLEAGHYSDRAIMERTIRTIEMKKKRGIW